MKLPSYAHNIEDKLKNIGVSFDAYFVIVKMKNKGWDERKISRFFGHFDQMVNIRYTDSTKNRLQNDHLTTSVLNIDQLIDDFDKERYFMVLPYNVDLKGDVMDDHLDGARVLIGKSNTYNIKSQVVTGSGTAMTTMPFRDDQPYLDFVYVGGEIRFGSRHAFLAEGHSVESAGTIYFSRDYKSVLLWGHDSGHFKIDANGPNRRIREAVSKKFFQNFGEEIGDKFKTYAEIEYFFKPERK